jgi:uncharacterized protein (DUF58 family)
LDQAISVGEFLRRLRWPLARRLAIHPGGDERSRVRGAGLEYSDVREYQPGDDPRTIDWNITARSDRPYVRESLPERGIDAWLLVDLTRSLDWGTARCLKRQLSVQVAVLAGRLLVQRGNRIGALLFDQRVHTVIRPMAGRTALLRLLARVERAADATPAGPTDLGRALREANRLVRRPSLVIVISDFLSADGWQQPIRWLGLRHELIAAWITDPREHEIPHVGVVTFEDPESGHQLVVDTADARLRARFQEAARTQRRTLLEELTRARAAVMELTTAEDAVPQLVRFLQRRRAEARARSLMTVVAAAPLQVM